MPTNINTRVAKLCEAAVACERNKDPEFKEIYARQLYDAKHDLIHPQWGAYFAIYAKYGDLDWCLHILQLFESREEAQAALEVHLKQHNALWEKEADKWQFCIERAVLHTTDITEWT